MLINCSDCDKQISSEAVYCPHCGRQENDSEVSVRFVDISIRNWILTSFKMTVAALPAAVSLAVVFLLIKMTFLAT
jgi:succinate-acetate transporter protein